MPISHQGTKANQSKYLVHDLGKFTANKVNFPDFSHLRLLDELEAHVLIHGKGVVAALIDLDFH